MFTAVKNTTLCLALLIFGLVAQASGQDYWAKQPDRAPAPRRMTEEIDGQLLETISEGANISQGTHIVPDGEDLTYFSREIPPTGSSGEWKRPGLWYFDTDFVMMHRSKSKKVELSAQAVASGVTGLPVVVDVAMTTDDRRFGFEPGAKMTLGRFLCTDEENRDYSLEFTYFGMYEWNASHGVVRGNDLNGSGIFLVTMLDDYTAFTPTPTAGFTGADSQSYNYLAALDSYEFNLRIQNRPTRDRNVLTDGVWHREMTPGFIWGFLGGLRLFDIEESFQFTSRGTITAANSGDYYVKTHNDLLGLQLGFDVREQHKKWSYGARAKAGGFYNFASQDSSIRQLDAGTGLAPPTDSLTFGSADDNQLAFMVEAGMFVDYEITPNFVMHMAYDFMFINGLALAPEQLTTNAVQRNHVRTTGHTLYDGFSFGFTWYR